MLYLILVLLFTHCIEIKAEVFTSVVELEALLATEKRTIDELQQYIQKKEELLSMLKRYLHDIKIEHKEAMKDIPNYIGNPINAFRLIKRLTIDLEYINDSIIKIEETKLKSIIKQNYMLYPAMEDLTGAALALARLQRIYHLDAKELAKGVIDGVAYSGSMTTSDCYKVGEILFNEGDYNNSLAWLLEAFKMYNEENNLYPFKDHNILEHFSNACFELDELQDAIKWIQRLLDIAPKHPLVQKISSFYQQLASSAKRLKMSDVRFNEKTKKTDETDFENYEALCRGEFGIPVHISSRLTCRFMSGLHPFYLMAPFKTEILYLKPDIVLFHNVLSDHEIEKLKRLARPKLTRSEIIVNETGKLIFKQYRISKSAGLSDFESRTVARISQRVAHMTGLSIEYAERLQILNYGIGGHYGPHYDYFGVRPGPEASKLVKRTGNRLATVLFYASDVNQGGDTVFSNIGVKIAPIKGSAIFFYNILPDGSKDADTRHGSCPVLHGSKWVATKWLHEYGQELLKPCRKEDHIDEVPDSVDKSLELIKRNKLRPSELS